jgi:hypothetical protein
MGGASRGSAAVLDTPFGPGYGGGIPGGGPWELRGAGGASSSLLVQRIGLCSLSGIGFGASIGVGSTIGFGGGGPPLDARAIGRRGRAVGRTTSGEPPPPKTPAAVSWLAYLSEPSAARYP